MARVARRYSMNANLIFTWLRDPRFAPGVEGEPGSVFFPVEVSRDVAVDPSMISECPPVSTGRLRIELAGGHRIVAEGGFDGDALGRLLKGWLS
ncbi:MAG: IS66 family insertion sequence element accessory protein TnpB [Rhodospirillales bacterium]|nr:IS66 family insertion sequence element accessory protein TnpB [Rhodospirillales bacterium]